MKKELRKSYDNLQNSAPIKIFSLNEENNIGIDQSYDHLLKENRRMEESKDEKFEDNEELKEGFIDNLYKPSPKQNSFNEIDKILTYDLPEGKSRVKTAFQPKRNNTTLGEINKSHENKIVGPMINKFYEEDPEEQKNEEFQIISKTPQIPIVGANQSNIELELQALVSENQENDDHHPGNNYQNLVDFLS